MVDKKRILNYKEPVRTALKMLNELGEDLTLFVIDENETLIGTLTDGDIRRALLKGHTLQEETLTIINRNYRYILEGNYTVSEILDARNKGVQILPLLNEKKQIIRLINFSVNRSFLPVDAVIMAGGEGIRLRPFTEELPKPLLRIGDKPIMEHLIDRLVQFGIENIQISINYLGEKICDYFGDGKSRDISISYIKEKNKLGTIGSITLAAEFRNDTIMILNSDLLTNIDFEEFFLEFVKKDADMAVACIPYTVNIPYAILETQQENIVSLKEKPNLTYYSNAGIYLVKKKHIKNIPSNSFFNATDLINTLIADSKKVIYYPLLGYWLDIGKIDDFRKAQEDIKHIKF